MKIQQSPNKFSYGSASAGTLTEAITEVVATNALKESLALDGIEVMPMSPTEFSSVISI